MLEIKKIKILQEHIDLLSRAYVGWCDDEFGAPQIDPKRSYGNSGVIEDMAEILDLVKPGDYDDIHDALSDKKIDKLIQLHKQTMVVVQIILSNPTKSPRSLVGKVFALNDHYNWEIVR